MSVTDMSQAVQDAGSRTGSPNFRMIVNAALTRGAGAVHGEGRAAAGEAPTGEELLQGCSK